MNRLSKTIGKILIGAGVGITGCGENTQVMPKEENASPLTIYKGKIPGYDVKITEIGPSSSDFCSFLSGERRVELHAREDFVRPQRIRGELKC